MGYRLREMSEVVRGDLNFPKDRFDLYMGLLILSIFDPDSFQSQVPELL